MNRFTLALQPPDLEAAWWHDQAVRHGDQQRLSVMALVLVESGFAVVDRLAFPGAWRDLWAIRAAVLLLMAPALPVFFASARTLARYGQLALLWLAVVAFGSYWPMGGAMGIAARPDDLVFSVPAVVLSLLVLFGASGLRFPFAAPVGVGAAVGFLLRLGPSEASTPVFLLVALAGLTSGLGIGLFVCWWREARAREDFVRRRELEREKRRSEALLRNLVPEALARRLEAGPGPHLDRVEATVVFATVVGFDAERYSPLDGVALLDRVVGGIDAVALAYGVERIKTVGATVLLASGVPEPVPDHVRRAGKLALALRDEVARVSLAEGVPLTLRVGVCSGPLVAGVVGRTRYAYDVWGDTVNTASRLDSHGEAGRIQVAEATAERLRELGFEVRERGEIEVKGKGRLRTAWLEG